MTFLGHLIFKSSFLMSVSLFIYHLPFSTFHVVLLISRLIFTLKKELCPYRRASMLEKMIFSSFSPYPNIIKYLPIYYYSNYFPSLIQREWLFLLLKWTEFSAPNKSIVSSPTLILHLISHLRIFLL